LLQQRHHSHLLITAEDLLQIPIFINQNATIYNAVEGIMSHNISAIIVENGAQYGVLSQKDIARAMLEEDKNIKEIPAAQKIQDLVSVDQYAPISNCSYLMLAKKTNMLGIKYGGEVKGVMTKHDLVKYFYQNIVDERKLSEIMSIGSFFVPHTTTLHDALKKMLDNQISRLLIKDSNDKPVGIVTYKSFLNNAIYYSNRYGDNVFSSGFGKKSEVSDVMTKNIITVSIRTSLRKVAKILIEYRIHGVAVTQNDKIVGFVTEKDIVRQLAKLDV
jgi:CBS domain-containing protein